MSDNLEQTKSVEERINFLETELQAVKERLSKLEVPSPEDASLRTLSPNKIPAKTEDDASGITVTLVSKTFHKANFSLGDTGDRIDFTFTFQSHLEKDVRAFKGAVVIKDLFDQDILRVTLTHETGLSAKGKAIWKGGIKFNKFLATHTRLLTVEQKDITVIFVCESIIYTDGTRESLI